MNRFLQVANGRKHSCGAERCAFAVSVASFSVPITVGVFGRSFGSTSGSVGNGLGSWILYLVPTGRNRGFAGHRSVFFHRNSYSGHFRRAFDPDTTIPALRDLGRIVSSKGDNSPAVSTARVGHLRGSKNAFSPKLLRTGKLQ